MQIKLNNDKYYDNYPKYSQFYKLLMYVWMKSFFFSTSINTNNQQLLNKSSIWRLFSFAIIFFTNSASLLILGILWQEQVKNDTGQS